MDRNFCGRSVTFYSRFRAVVHFGHCKNKGVFYYVPNDFCTLANSFKMTRYAKSNPLERPHLVRTLRCSNAAVWAQLRLRNSRDGILSPKILRRRFSVFGSIYFAVVRHFTHDFPVNSYAIPDLGGRMRVSDEVWVVAGVIARMVVPG